MPDLQYVWVPIIPCYDQNTKSATASVMSDFTVIVYSLTNAFEAL